MMENCALQNDIENLVEIKNVSKTING